MKCPRCGNDMGFSDRTFYVSNPNNDSEEISIEVWLYHCFKCEETVLKEN